MIKTEKKMDTLKTAKSRFEVPRNLIKVVATIVILGAILAMVVQMMLRPARPTLKNNLATNVQKPTTNNTPTEKALDDIIKKQEEEGTALNKAKNEQAGEVATTLATQQPSAANYAVPGQRELGQTPLSGITQKNTSAPSSYMPPTGATGVKLPGPPLAMGSPSGSSNAPTQIDIAAREVNIRAAPILASMTGGSDQAGSDYSSALRGNGQSTSGQAQIPAAVTVQKPAVDPNLAALVAQNKGPQKQSDVDWLKETAKYDKTHDVSHGYTPPSRFMLLQGALINALLLTALNTDLPGEARARVLMDVYDSIKGDYLLIPKGSVLVGKYNSSVRPGQDRINVAFTRLVLPNGISVDLPGNQAAMGDGTTGVSGDVNNHYLTIFGVSLVSAAGAYYTQTPQSLGGTTINTGNTPAINASGQIFTDMSNAVIQRNSAVQPTITVPSGTRFTISVAQDIELPPYRP